MKVPKPTKKKKITLTKAKAKAWEQFSLYIRLRDEKDGCFTCGIKKPYKELQAGHWIPGRHNSVLFEEMNCHTQCYHCNVGLKSNLVVYYDKMLKVYGTQTCERLKQMDKVTSKFKPYELLDMADKYKEMVLELLK